MVPVETIFVPNFLTIEVKYDNSIDLESVEVNFGKAERL
jgi:hypothetical protein